VKVATWNVNGIRAPHRSVQLLDFIAAERPDILCLQEIKASPDQLTFELRDVEGYWGHWHGTKGYSGVAMLVSRTFDPDGPEVLHPVFDFENRVCTATLTTAAGNITFASIYVPNGGKDYPAKLRFLEALETWTAEAQRKGETLVICGDLNVARSDMDIHPKERKPGQVGARPDERAIFEQMISHGLVDIQRTLEPDNENLFTWWAPWRNLRQRNIGWRIDYVLASDRLANTVKSAGVLREVGTSDHGPVVVEFRLRPEGFGGQVGAV
jgi:exodeoxyribonuclease-3